MDYNLNCGCKVTVSDDTLTAEITYCRTHEAKKLSVPAGHLVDFTEAADNLVKDAHKNMEALAEAGRKLVASMKIYEAKD